MLIDLVQLRTFVTVAEEQHLTRAAGRLSMSQSAASAHVRAIEERLGTQLFIRTNRHLELTHAGQLVAEKARKLLSEEALFTSFAREMKGQTDGRLKICSSSEPDTRIGTILTTMRARHPMITVELMAQPSSGTRQSLQSGESDIGVMIGRPIDPGLAYYELANLVYRIAGPIAWKDQIEGADFAALARLPWLTPNGSSAHSQMLWQLFGERGLELNTVISFDNSGIGRSALIAGAGMMLVREDRALQGERDGHLAVSPIGRQETSLLIAHQRARAGDPLIPAFLEAARESWPEMHSVEQV